jgi:hypothetical protein
MDIKARAESHLPTEEPTARTKDPPAVTLLKCIKARAEIRLQATREYLTWKRSEVWLTSFLLAREQEMLKVYMDFAEDQVEVYMSKQEEQVELPGAQSGLGGSQEKA